MTFPLVMSLVVLLLLVLLAAAFAAGRAVGYVAGIKYANTAWRVRLIEAIGGRTS